MNKKIIFPVGIGGKLVYSHVATVCMLWVEDLRQKMEDLQQHVEDLREQVQSLTSRESYVRESTQHRSTVVDNTSSLTSLDLDQTSDNVSTQNYAVMFMTKEDQGQWFVHVTAKIGAGTATGVAISEAEMREIEE